MNNILLAIISLDCRSFNKKTDYHLLMDYIDKNRELRDIDKILLTFYSSEEIYKSRDIIKSIFSIREEYPDIIFGRILTKNDGFSTSYFSSRNGKNKVELFEKLYKNYKSAIEVGCVLVMDDNLSDKFDYEDIFRDSEFIRRSFIPTEDNKKLKKTIN